MNSPLIFWLFSAKAVAFFLLATPATGEETAIASEQLSFFESKIRPVLIQECYSCHSSKTGNAKGGLRLDSEQLTHLGGESGPAVVPGDLDASLIYQAISYQEFAMPPKGRLSQTIIDDFRQWIEMGAPDPRKTEIATLNSTITNEDIKTAKATFWAYQKPLSPPIPSVSDPAWARSDIDRFVLAKLDDEALGPAIDAEPYQLFRRLSYDLIGLPPTLEQSNSFQREWKLNPDAAIASSVDRMLDSPQFGEHWARHWLDLARYAESNGREVNMTNPQAWRYRDYVIDAFNNDKPYDRFVQEQIAGDLLPVKSNSQWTENLVATSFLALGPKSLSEQNGSQFAADLADEQLDTTTRVFMGTSVACARCHDHKFDPIPQTDYYAMVGIFASTKTYFGAPVSKFGNLGGIQNRNKSTLIVLPVEDPNPFDRTFTKDELTDMADQVRELRQQLLDYRNAQRSGRSTGENSQVSIQNLVRLQTRLESISSTLGSVDENGKPITFCMGVQDSDSPRDARVLVRGEIDQPAQVVSRDFPQVLRDESPEIRPDSSGRLELARWMTQPDHPLTARVMVNRIWQHLLGNGIVRSTEDFGSTGQAPTHPELLDHLATQFVESKWSIKSMIHSIVTSRTYRMSTAFDEQKFQRDSDNEMLWRANSKRLNAEALRDTMLFVSGQLDLKKPRASEVAKAGYLQVRDGNLINIGQVVAMTGNNADSRQEYARQMIRRELGGRIPEGTAGMSPRDMFDRFRRSGDSGPGGLRSRFINGTSDRVDMVDATYRSIYLPILRDELPRSMDVFDFAEPSMVIGAREASNTPNQALFMMNNEFVFKQSEWMAARILGQADTTTERINAAFLLAYGRVPTSSERAAVNAFITKFSNDSRYRNQFTLTLASLCQSLFASAEFRYLD